MFNSISHSFTALRFTIDRALRTNAPLICSCSKENVSDFRYFFKFQPCRQLSVFCFFFFFLKTRQLSVEISAYSQLSVNPIQTLAEVVCGNVGYYLTCSFESHPQISVPGSLVRPRTHAPRDSTIFPMSSPFLGATCMKTNQVKSPYVERSTFQLKQQ